MSYTTEDFAESLERVALQRSDIAIVVAAWGKGDGMGEDAGHYCHSEEGVTEWAGGFLMRLKDGRFAYLTGWCDYTGWGCQDGAELYYFDAPPDLSALAMVVEILKAPDFFATLGHTDFVATGPAPAEWDHEPADLNRWLVNIDEPARQD